jgi:hypothetical protein
MAHVSALILPHPAMTAAQCELVCRREGLALAHLGRARLVLVQTSAPRQTVLRVARPDPVEQDLQRRRDLIRAAREELERLSHPGPEAA